MLCINFSIAPDEESDGNSQNSSIKVAHFGITHQNRIVHLELPRKIANRLRIVIDRNSDDLQSFLTEVILELNKSWDLVTTWIAPCRPEIQQYNFAAVVA